MDLEFPHQLFINNEFVDASNGDTYKTINPNDETAICELSKATVEDVDTAVAAAKVCNWKDNDNCIMKNTISKLLITIILTTLDHTESYNSGVCGSGGMT